MVDLLYAAIHGRPLAEAGHAVRAVCRDAWPVRLKRKVSHKPMFVSMDEDSATGIQLHLIRHEQILAFFPRTSDC